MRKVPTQCERTLVKNYNALIKWNYSYTCSLDVKSVHIHDDFKI